MTTQTVFLPDDWYEYYYPLEPDNDQAGKPFVPPSPPPTEDLGQTKSSHRVRRVGPSHAMGPTQQEVLRGPHATVCETPPVRGSNNLAIALAQELAIQKADSGLPADGRTRSGRALRPAPGKPDRGTARSPPPEDRRRSSRDKRKDQQGKESFPHGPLHLANVSTGAVIEACATRLRARSAMAELEACFCRLCTTAGVPPPNFNAAAAAVHTPSHSVTPAPTASTASKNAVRLEATFSPIAARDAMNAMYSSGSNSDHNDPDYIDPSKGRPPRCDPVSRPKKTHVTFADDVSEAFSVSTTATSRSWVFSQPPPTHSGLSVSAQPFVPANSVVHPVVVPGQALDDLSVPNEWRLYTMLNAQSYYINYPIDSFVEYVNVTIQKVAEKPNLERLMHLTADLAKKVSDFQLQVATNYASTNETNLQLILNEGSERTKERFCNVARRRLQSTTQQAVDRAGQATLELLRQQQLQHSNNASAPSYPSLPYTTCYDIDVTPD